ncbi:MAG TPA: NAD(P)/FAD-dependent oxidoreductase [Steroidobacteraceae bacterium]|nr:NAD(P)/FAD-dependent oxidoreductase [Steroidobacteraceae bacterium]
MERVDAVVIGAGVVGLAIARALALRGREVLILEAAERFGSGVSSRNSEVIHAGIYYPRGSLKARFCVAGRERLYDFCREHGVEHRRCGKLIVASSESQRAGLERIRAGALGNGVELVPLERAQALALEPELRCAAALHSPLTGIIDAHGYMLALLGQAESRGALLVCNSEVTGLTLHAGGFGIAVNGAPPSLQARTLVNSAGLSAPAVARLMEGFPAERVPTAWLLKGSYFALSGRAPFARLIYPLPERDALGVHLTLDLAGRARFGPDVEWVEELDYAVDPQRAAAFYRAIREWWPALADGSLEPAYSGMRPKITGPGEPPTDFRIDGQAEHGVPGLVHLFGIESPGLTSSLAIAEHVAALLA